MKAWAKFTSGSHKKNLQSHWSSWCRRFVAFLTLLRNKTSTLGTDNNMPLISVL